MEITISYYDDQSRISNSAIGWYNKKGPRYLRDMLDGKAEGISGKFLERGTMIHEYILQPEEFWNDYEILDFATPSVKQQKDFCEEYYRLMSIRPLDDHDTTKLDAYKFAYSNKKTDAQSIIAAEEIIEVYQDYLQYLSKSVTKKIISFSDLAMLKTIKNNLLNHTAAKSLLWVDQSIESHNEFHINWTHPKTGVLCKSLIDRVIFDHKAKVVTLIDLKTTADVYNFKHSVEEYDYHRQIQFYLEAIEWYFTEELKLNFKEYKVQAYIVAIQTSDKYEVRVFNMFNQNVLTEKSELISDTLQRISYHTETDSWEHTRNYYENDGIEELLR